MTKQGEEGQIGMFSFCLPVFLTPFHDPTVKLLLSRIPRALPGYGSSGALWCCCRSGGNGDRAATISERLLGIA